MLLVGDAAAETRARMGRAAASVGVRDAAARVARLVETELPAAPRAPKQLAAAKLGRVHLVGVGGAGMSAVAALLAARGLVVSGSDAADGPALPALRDAGVTVHVGHDAALVDGVDTVVVSSAVRESNPELVRARALGIRVLHRSEALAALMVGRDAIAVAGAHGKTTTSAMVATALLDAGADPSFAIGGTVLTVDGPLGGSRDGSGRAFVAEADESDGSFLAYAPLVAVVTNVEPDHLDHYGSAEAFEDAFVAFAERIRPGGALVACADDAGAVRLVDRVRAQLSARDVDVVTYGTSPTADVVVGDLRPDGAAWSVDLTTADGVLTVRLAVPGVHNALNAGRRVGGRAAARHRSRRDRDRARGVPGDGPPVRGPGDRRRGPRRRRLRPPPDRGRRTAPAGALGRRWRSRARPVPAAPLLSHPDVRHRVRCGVRPRRRRSSSPTSTPPARTRTPTSPVR